MSNNENLLPIDERTLTTAESQNGVVRSANIILGRHRVSGRVYVLRNFVSTLVRLDINPESHTSAIEPFKYSIISERERSGSILGLGIEYIKEVFERNLQVLPPRLRDAYALGVAAKWKTRGEVEFVYDDLGIYRDIETIPTEVKFSEAHSLPITPLGNWETMPPEVRMVYGGDWERYPKPDLREQAKEVFEKLLDGFLKGGK